MCGDIYKCGATFINVGQRHHRWAKKRKRKGMIIEIKGEGREGDRERETALRLHPDQREC